MAIVAAEGAKQLGLRVDADDLTVDEETESDK